MEVESHHTEDSMTKRCHQIGVTIYVRTYDADEDDKQSTICAKRVLFVWLTHVLTPAGSLPLILFSAVRFVDYILQSMSVRSRRRHLPLRPSRPTANRPPGCHTIASACQPGGPLFCCPTSGQVSNGIHHHAQTSILVLFCDRIGMIVGAGQQN